jgi:hypothetical protein
LPNAYEPPVLEVSCHNVTVVESEHCISPADALASRNEPIPDIVIPVPMITFAYVVVVKSALVIEVRKQRMKRAVRAEILRVVP